MAHLVKITADYAQELAQRHKKDLPQSGMYVWLEEGPCDDTKDYLTLRLDPEEQGGGKGWYLKSGYPPESWARRYDVVIHPEPVVADHDSWGTW